MKLWRNVRRRARERAPRTCPGSSRYPAFVIEQRAVIHGCGLQSGGAPAANREQFARRQLRLTLSLDPLRAFAQGLRDSISYGLAGFSLEGFS